jgi:hypothetical protein
MRVGRVLNSQKGPRFKGFVSAPLFELRRTIKLPNTLSPHQRHNCFGYRVLQESFEDSEFLQNVIELCGSELGCHPLRSPSPGLTRSSTSPIRIKSPSPFSDHHARVITSADYLDDEDLEKYISQLTRQEGKGREVLGEPGPSTRAKPVR